MDAKTIKRLDDIYVVKQLTENGLSASKISKLLNLPESIVRSYQNQ